MKQKKTEVNIYDTFQEKAPKTKNKSFLDSKKTNYQIIKIILHFRINFIIKTI